MKKKGIATLALAGALAVSMVPAFAAGGHQTTVGYTAGGSVDPSGRVMVTVPKDVTFTNTKKTINEFDVKAMVWDSAKGAWTEPGTITLGKTIDVSVASGNGFKLKNDTAAAGVVGTYNYKVGQTTLDTTTGANKATKIGTLKDAGTDAGQQPAVYKLGGTLNLITTPDVGQTQNAVYLTDVLTYTFTNMA